MQEKICVKDIYNYPFCEEKKSFTWEEIKDFFCELTLPQLELVFYENIQRIYLTKYAWHRDLEIWREEYIKHIIIGYSVWRNEEWLDWWSRGYALAKQLCKILPSNIRLGYGNFEQCNNVISKWGSRWELNTKGCKVIVSADMSQKSKEGLFIQKAYIDYAFDEDELLNYKFEVDQDCHNLYPKDLILLCANGMLRYQIGTVLRVDENSIIVHVNRWLDISEEYTIELIDVK